MKLKCTDVIYRYAVLVVFAALGSCAYPGPKEAAAETMRAAVIVDGGIEIRTVQVPEPQTGQVRIKVHAVSVNPVDWKIAAMTSGGDRIAGRDLAGIIDAIGPSATGWKIGDAVTGISASGSYAEYALASVDAIAAKPGNMSFEEAAGMGVVADTAWLAIVTVGDVKPGQKVLIHGGAGGVGSSAVQIARARGAYVIATASPRNHQFLKSIGADEVIDYNTTRFEDVVTGPDFVLNTADMDTGIRSIGVIREGGVLVSIVGPPPADLCGRAGIRCAETGRATGEMLKNVVDLANAGKFHISIDRVFPLEEANAAWDMNRGGHTRGKIILQVAD